MYNDAKSKKFFATFRQGKCVNLNVGENYIAVIPKKVASYLGLENSESYTWHLFRRSSASMLVEGGGDFLTLKRRGGWNSFSVAEGYVEGSIPRKIYVSKKLLKTATVVPIPQPKHSNSIYELRRNNIS